MKTALVLAMSLVLSATLQAGSIKKWYDEDGNVHFGDTPPPAANTSQVEVRPQSGESSGAGDYSVEAQLRRMQGKSQAGSGNSGQKTQGNRKAGKKRQGGSNGCKARMAEYRRSKSCFDNFRQPNGRLSSEAYSHCKEMKRPDCQ
ncbi:DUF4124 domain-containing protein [Thiolapillus sp.]